MDVYNILPERLYDTLQAAIRNWKPTLIIVHGPGGKSWRAKMIVRRDLRKHRLTIQRYNKGFRFAIDGKRVFDFEISEEQLDKLWVVHFERIKADGTRDIPDVSYTDPNAKELPRVEKSVMRGANLHYHVSIFFQDQQIPLRKRRSMGHGSWYWTIRNGK